MLFIVIAKHAIQCSDALGIAITCVMPSRVAIKAITMVSTQRPYLYVHLSTTIRRAKAVLFNDIMNNIIA